MLEFLYEALHSPFGRVVHTHGKLEPTRQKLYAIRREVNDPDLAVLSFLQSPSEPDDLWIVKTKEKSDAKA